jgi:hypothetical protein
MTGKFSLALLLALAVVLAPLPTFSLGAEIVSGATSGKAIKASCCTRMSCCAKTSCCKMPAKNGSPIVPPLARRSTSANTNPIIAPTAASIFVAANFPSAQYPKTDLDFSAHSPPVLALICVRLI